MIVTFSISSFARSIVKKSKNLTPIAPRTAGCCALCFRFHIINSWRCWQWHPMGCLCIMYATVKPYARRTAVYRRKKIIPPFSAIVLIENIAWISFTICPYINFNTSSRQLIRNFYPHSQLYPILIRYKNAAPPYTIFATSQTGTAWRTFAVGGCKLFYRSVCGRFPQIFAKGTGIMCLALIIIQCTKF